MNKKVLILLAVVWTAALGLVGFSELRPEGSAERAREAASAGSAEPESAGTESGTGASAERQREADASGAKAGSGGAKPGGVAVRLGGEPGLEYAGSCLVDGEERELGGRVPETYTYEPEDRLECEISSRDRGPLRVTFSDAGDVNTVQQLGPQPGTLTLVYTGDSLSTSTSSGTGTGGSQTSSSQVGSSQTSISQSSRTNTAQASSQSSYQSSSSVVRSGSR